MNLPETTREHRSFILEEACYEVKFTQGLVRFKPVQSRQVDLMRRRGLLPNRVRRNAIFTCM